MWLVKGVGKGFVCFFAQQFTKRLHHWFAYDKLFSEKYKPCYDMKEVIKMKKRKLLLPLIFIAMFLFCGTVHAAYNLSDGEVVSMSVDSEDSSHLYFDGRSYTDSKLVFHKFTIKKPSLMCLFGLSYTESGEVYDNRLPTSMYAVYNSKGKKMMDLNYGSVSGLNSPVAFFFLKEGTYYVATNCYRPYALHLSYKSYSRKIATQKSKAVNLAKNKTVNGYFLRGEKGVHWYKIKLTKKQKINFAFSSLGENSVSYTFYTPKNGNSTRSVFCDAVKAEYFLQPGKKALPKGTYYIKVTRNSGTPSCQYSLHWK